MTYALIILLQIESHANNSTNQPRHTFYCSNETSDAELNESFVDSLLGMIELKHNDRFFNFTVKKGCCQKINSTMTSLH